MTNDFDILIENIKKLEAVSQMLHEFYFVYGCEDFKTLAIEIRDSKLFLKEKLIHKIERDL